ncbi:folate-binding protein [Lysobacter pythonis]|uniref:Folate-binding protein n=1 Tax=Solilutibacter pythonis TaxID=2483112 RepID=A0A3M2I174_9GAMM|nr:folate-binding protein YgfZ [Lysobacter pythonis]RMH94878.1 folate-binding protein [Lysobacter pythonis]
MSDNPTEVESAFIALPDHRLLAITGADALKFTQAQFMNDVTTLADGGWQWNGWLNAKGRVIALFALLRLDAETLWLVLPDFPPSELAGTLKRYVFRSKVKLEPRDELQVSGRLYAGAIGCRAFQGDAANALRLDWPDQRELRIGPAVATGNAPALARWRAADLRAGLPRLNDSQREKWTPQQLSLDRLDAYSVKKGCYPGQEIVARTHFLGQAKRGPRLLQTASAVATGDTVTTGERGIGEVVSTAGTLALAVLPLECDESALRIGEQAVEVLV